MAGLLWPITGHATTQGFAGNNAFEPAGFLAVDAIGPRRARTRRFPNSAGAMHLHGAIDIGCPIGTVIVAPETGKVVAADRYESTGERYMMVQLKPGTILFFTHLRSFSAAVGQRVARGVEIARSGNTGMSTGPHLHWEVRVTKHAEADFRRSGRWFKWNPQRLRVGGDLAGLVAIVPPGFPAAPVEIAIDSEPDSDLELEVDEMDDDEPDTFGDAAALLDRPYLLIDSTGKRRISPTTVSHGLGVEPANDQGGTPHSPEPASPGAFTPSDERGTPERATEVPRARAKGAQKDRAKAAISEDYLNKVQPEARERGHRGGRGEAGERRGTTTRRQSTSAGGAGRSPKPKSAGR